MENTLCDVNQNSTVIPLRMSDGSRNSISCPQVSQDGNNSIAMIKEGIRTVDLCDRDRGDDTSTTSSGVSSGGSATASVGSSTTPSLDKGKKRFDISLTSWNIWQEDADFEPPSDDEDEGISNAGLRRYKSVDYSSDTNKKKRFSGFFRRFSLRDSRNISVPKHESMELKQLPKEVRVESLPQYFVSKHLGYRRGTGLFGLKHIRRPVDEMIAAVGKLPKGQELTLAQIHITKKGIHLSAHADNTGPALPAEFIPLEFVSYGVQDLVHTRVFCLILVRVVSRHAKKIECHAFVCNSNATAKKMALSVGLAFQKYAASLKGQAHRFEVKLDKGKKDQSGTVGTRTEFDA